LNPRIERINGDIDKIKGKISELQGKQRELERQRTEIENADIISAVRGMDISLDDLAAFMKRKNTTSGQNVPKSTTPQKENDKEDN